MPLPWGLGFFSKAMGRFRSCVGVVTMGWASWREQATSVLPSCSSTLSIACSNTGSSGCSIAAKVHYHFA